MMDVMKGQRTSTFPGKNAKDLTSARLARTRINSCGCQFLSGLWLGSHLVLKGKLHPLKRDFGFGQIIFVTNVRHVIIQL